MYILRLYLTMKRCQNLNYFKSTSVPQAPQHHMWLVIGQRMTKCVFCVLCLFVFFFFFISIFLNGLVFYVFLCFFSQIYQGCSLDSLSLMLKSTKHKNTLQYDVFLCFFLVFFIMGKHKNTYHMLCFCVFLFKVLLTFPAMCFLCFCVFFSSNFFLGTFVPFFFVMCLFSPIKNFAVFFLLFFVLFPAYFLPTFFLVNFNLFFF